MDFQICEAIRLCSVSLNSTTIEWAMNIEICDILSANPPIAAHLTEHIGEALSSTSVRRASLALSLVEILIKNLGISFLRFVDDKMCEAWGALCLRKSSWRYSITRNVFKVTQQIGTSDEESAQWQQVCLRARGLLQEASDSLLLHEAQAPAFFRFYKHLRRQHITFPPKSQSALIRGGIEEEELPPPSPKKTVTGATPSSPSQSAPSPPRRLPDSTPLRADEVDELRIAVETLESENPTSESAEVCRRLRPRLITLIQVHAVVVDSEFDEVMLEAMMALLSRLDTAVEPFAPPPPPEPAPEHSVAQQNADFLFAVMLQQQELDSSTSANPFGGMLLGPSARNRLSHARQHLGLIPHGSEQSTMRQIHAPPPHAMDNSGSYLIESVPVAPTSIEGSSSASVAGPALNSSRTAPVAPAMGSNGNSLETSLLGSASSKKPKIWGQLRELALRATTKRHTLGEASSTALYYSTGEEGIGLIRKTPDENPQRRGLLQDDESEEKEEDWDLVRTEKQTYWFNKRTLRSQWTAPRWAQRKAKQLKEL